MVQILLGLYGLMYLVRLLRLGGMTAGKLGLEPEAFPDWRRLQRLHYGWMLAATWGGILCTLILGFMVGIGVVLLYPRALQGSTLTLGLLNLGTGVVCLVIVYLCYRRSKAYSRQAEALVSEHRVSATGLAR